jgi:hypothetical protein
MHDISSKNGVPPIYRPFPDLIDSIDFPYGAHPQGGRSGMRSSILHMPRPSGVSVTRVTDAPYEAGFYEAGSE